MNKVIVVAALVGVFSAGIANAQESRPLGLTLRAGIFFPNSDAAKRNAGKQWIGGGAEYKLGDLQFANEGNSYGASYSISVDLYQKKDFRHVPVLLNYVGRSNQGIFYTAGVGVGFARELNSLNQKKNHTTFSYQVGVGYEFTKSQVPVFIEAKYVGSSRNRLNGYGIFAGIRF